MKEEKTKSKKRILYYCILTVSVLLLAAAIVLTVYFVTGRGGEVLKDPDDVNQPNNPDDNDPDDKDPDKPTGGDNVDPNPYVAPVASVTYSLEYGDVYKNQTVGWIYRHYAIDFAAELGAAVCSMADGTVTEVSYSKELGNRITIDHGKGLESSYTFVTPVTGITVGQKVTKGEKIAEVSEACGTEKKDGTHLHFEVKENGKNVNPTKYFEAFLEEK